MTMITIDSLIVGSRTKVEVDPYGTNPLAEDCRQASPAAYNVALAKAGPPPKLFTDGTADLPAFTAVGFDPAELMRLPALTRHPCRLCRRPCDGAPLVRRVDQRSLRAHRPSRVAGCDPAGSRLGIGPDGPGCGPTDPA